MTPTHECIFSVTRQDQAGGGEGLWKGERGTLGVELRHCAASDEHGRPLLPQERPKVCFLCVFVFILRLHVYAHVGVRGCLCANV